MDQITGDASSSSASDRTNTGPATESIIHKDTGPISSADARTSSAYRPHAAETEQRRGAPPQFSVGGETWSDFLTSTAALTDGDRTDQQEIQVTDPTTGMGRKRQPTMTDDTVNKRPNTDRTPSSPTTHLGTATHPIDLTTPERPLPSRTSRSSAPRRSSIESIILPTWQPDPDVTRCPVCGTLFSFWYRKHHCRKCGRVVCANCSPHRITIPRQFIVQPPATASPFAALAGVIEITDYNRNPVLQQEEAGGLARLSAGLGGGETVRVCNPCVPDPNFDPPPQKLVAGTSSGVASAAINTMSSRPGGPVQTTFSSDIIPSSAVTASRPIAQHSNSSRAFVESGRRATIAPITGLSSQLPSLQRVLPPFAHSLGQATLGFASRSYNPRYADRSMRPASSVPRPAQPSVTPRIPPRQIAEEDECPVCGHELPPRGPDGDEDARIRHVDTCLQRYSTPSTATLSTTTAITVTSAPPPTPASTETSSSRAVVHAPADANPNLQPASTAQAEEATSSVVAAPVSRTRGMRGNRMLVYRAGEKDYMGEDGEPQECVICFEEFEPGDELGRLECLCKFHRVCIRQWWETKGVGSCPTHQLHD